MTARTVTGDSPWVLGTDPGELRSLHYDNELNPYAGRIVPEWQASSRKTTRTPPSVFDGISLACDHMEHARQCGCLNDSDTCCRGICVGGAPIIELRKLCTANHLQEPDSPLCDDDGYVTVRASVHAVQFIHNSEMVGIPAPCVETWDDDGAVLWLSGSDDGIPIKLPDDAEVEHWAIIAIPVNEGDLS